MTTEAPVKVCSHLRTGKESSFMEVDGARYCFDCCAGIYKKTHDFRFLTGALLGHAWKGDY